MAKVTIAKAAEITGKSRATIDRYLKSGKLSYELQHGSSTRLIDPADLDRILAPSHSQDGELDGVRGANRSQTEIDLAVAKERIDGLERLLAEKDRRLALLEDQREKPREADAPRPPRTRSILWGLWKISE